MQTTRDGARREYPAAFAAMDGQCPSARARACVRADIADIACGYRSIGMNSYCTSSTSSTGTGGYCTCMCYYYVRFRLAADQNRPHRTGVDAHFSMVLNGPSRDDVDARACARERHGVIEIHSSLHHRRCCGHSRRHRRWRMIWVAIRSRGYQCRRRR